MGIHSPFSYVGYTNSMGETIIDLLERFCGGCHTNEDYDKGCKGCPAGQLIYAARDYILDDQEEDKHFEEYASDKWQEGRKKNGMPEESVEEREKWARMAELHKKESIALRGMKKELKRIEPYPGFYAQWIWESTRKPDPLLKFREYLKDFHFQTAHRMDDWKISGKISEAVRLRMRDELSPLIVQSQIDK